MSVWKTLSAIDVSKHIEKKGKFSYLSWAWAWSTLKEHYPDATFKKEIFDDIATGQVPYMKDNDGYAYVVVTVTVEGVAATEIMPVLNHQNKSIQNPNSFDVNTALQRTLVKAIAFHGLGLYIYAGEDLPNLETTGPYDPFNGKKNQVADLCERTGTSFSDVESYIMADGSVEASIIRLEKKLEEMGVEGK